MRDKFILLAILGLNETADLKSKDSEEYREFIYEWILSEKDDFVYLYKVNKNYLLKL